MRVYDYEGGEIRTVLHLIPNSGKFPFPGFKSKETIMDRRHFIKAAAVGGLAAALDPVRILASDRLFRPQYFALHPFVDAHPEAVFIRRTNVPIKTNGPAKLSEGQAFAQELFTLSGDRGISLTSSIGLKPNLTCTSGLGDTDDGMGIRTDPYFIEGMIKGMTGVGFPAGNVYMREGNLFADGYCTSEYGVSHLMDIADRTGIHFLDFSTGRKLYELGFETLVENEEVVWRDVPQGAVFSRAGFIAPFNAADTWIVNIAKFKTHTMGMTLCAKNLQGISVSPLVRYCESVDTILAHTSNIVSHFSPTLKQNIDAAYSAHLAAGIPRWQRAGTGFTGGYGMETWSQRTCDAHSVMNQGIHIIEGIYGRCGDGFAAGPGPGGAAVDYPSNILVFGRNPFRVDIIGTWLAGHEPGNFGFFHIAKERGLCDVLNPLDIPVYAWNGGSPLQTPLNEFERTPLVCPYLRKDYDGGTEPEYHLVNEPYQYPTAVEQPAASPASMVLGQNHANPVSSITYIDYELPGDGWVRIDVFDSSGRRVDVLVDGFRRRGAHLAVWDASHRPAGSYHYRMSALGKSQTRRMIVVR
jgi:hypothetical protein